MNILKKLFIVSVMFYTVFSLSYAQSNNKENRADVVVLMDTSGTILPYYKAINERVLKSITDTFVRKGDTFHLLSFNERPRSEMFQKVDTEAQLSRVVSRFMLLYQLGQHADFLAALHFAEEYVGKLNAQHNKILIVISDGIFNPPHFSPYKNYSPEQIKTELAKTASSIRDKGWKVYYIKLPFPSEAEVKNLDGSFYAGTVNKDGELNRSGVENAADRAGGNLSIEDTSGHSGAQSAASQRSGDQNLGTQGADTDSFAAVSDGQNKDGYTQNGRVQNTARDNVSGNSEEINGLESNHGANPTGASGNQASGVNDSDGALAQTDTEGTASEGAFDQSEDGNKKVYTDVSEEFTRDLGIEASELPDEGLVAFNEDNAPLPRVLFPESLITSGNNIEIPLSVENVTDETITLTIQALSFGAENKVEKTLLNDRPVIVKPNSSETFSVTIPLHQACKKSGDYTADMRLELFDGQHYFSQGASVLLSVSAPAALFGLDLTLLIIIVVIILLLLLLLFLFFRSRSGSAAPAKGVVPLRSSAEDTNATNQKKQSVMYDAVKREDGKDSLHQFKHQTAAASAAVHQQKAAQFGSVIQEKNRAVEGRLHVLNNSGRAVPPPPPPLFSAEQAKWLSVKYNKRGMTELFVFNQTTWIGKRNIHIMKTGSVMSVGGAKSDNFYIFLVPFPGRLAQIEYDGRDHRLVILKPEYFPYEVTNVIPSCFGKTVTAVSDKGYHVLFTFRGYEDPMERLNSILTSIQHSDSE